MFSSPHRRDDQRGFTLLEVLLAVAALATVAALVFASLASTVRLVDSVRDAAGREHVIRSTLRLMADELMSAQLHPSSPWIGQNGQQNGRPADVVAFLSSSQIRAREEAAESELARVLYTREGTRLIRLARRNLYGLTDEWLERTDLADHVVGFDVRYFDPLSRTWVDEWDGRTRRSQPQAVAIELTFQFAEEDVRIIREWITVGAQS
ncbi:MAG TPA: type II secretion system protein GspJ [Nitrospiraceae bacterium]|jgi:general secretion pathway protein J|nr:type II secretion system protein GspJ [Nitrospiraceae bacterium]